MTEWRDTYEFDESYLSATLRQGSHGKSIFGMRLIWESIDDLSKKLGCFYLKMPSDSARFQSAFGDSLYTSFP